MSIRTDVFPAHLIPQPLCDEVEQTSLAIFPNVDENNIDADGRHWSASELAVLAWDGDEWGSHVSIIRREIEVGGQSVIVGGIGGVMTVPHMRGRGLAKAAMHHAHDVICTQLNADAAMLYCLPQRMPFYESLGYYELQRRITYHQPDGSHIMDTRAHPTDRAMFRPCDDFVFPYGPLDIKGMLW